MAYMIGFVFETTLIYGRITVLGNSRVTAAKYSFL
tara:strand:- start:539 stop:643 length:105 start_codon:yes stop_codon:yes gene_type:complete